MHACPEKWNLTTRVAHGSIAQEAVGELRDRLIGVEHESCSAAENSRRSRESVCELRDEVDQRLAEMSSLLEKSSGESKGVVRAESTNHTYVHVPPEQMLELSRGMGFYI